MVEGEGESGCKAKQSKAKQSKAKRSKAKPLYNKSAAGAISDLSLVAPAQLLFHVTSVRASERERGSEGVRERAERGKGRARRARGKRQRNTAAVRRATKARCPRPHTRAHPRTPTHTHMQRSLSPGTDGQAPSSPRQVPYLCASCDASTGESRSVHLSRFSVAPSFQFCRESWSRLCRAARTSRELA
jgi:hypothetical protein